MDTAEAQKQIEKQKEEGKKEEGPPNQKGIGGGNQRTIAIKKGKELAKEVATGRRLRQPREQPVNKEVCQSWS
jgi:hypothetical protein